MNIRIMPISIVILGVLLAVMTAEVISMARELRRVQVNEQQIIAQLQELNRVLSQDISPKLNRP